MLSTLFSAVGPDLTLYVCVYVCMYVCMYVCLYNVCACMYNYMILHCTGQRDEVIGVGFGYAAHLLHMMALILNLPLRYPIIYRGSTSVIRDSISDASSLAASKGE